MFTGWSIRRRLVIIAVGFSVAILVIVAVLTINSTGPIIAAQTESALIARNQNLANMLDSEMRALDASLETLAASVSSFSARTTPMLWSQAGSLMNRNPSIRRVGALLPFRDGYQVLLFSRPPVPEAKAPFARIYRQTVPADAWFAQGMDADGTRWFGPHPAFYATGGGDMITVTTPIQRRNGETIGLLWLDVPLETLSEQMMALFRAQERFGYNLLIDEHNNIITGNALPVSVSGENEVAALRERADIRAVLDTFAVQMDNLIAADDPLNSQRDSFFIRSILPTNGWSIVSVLPTGLFQSALAQNRFQVILAALIGIFVLGILLYKFAQSAVTEPLTSLTLAAQEIGSGDMRYIVGHQDRGDEIGQLAHALETMKVNLAHSYEELSLWSRRLEKRVLERTEELEAAQKNAQQRAAELQAVYDASLSVVSEYYLKIMLQKLSERAESLLRAPYVSVWLMGEGGDYLQMVATTSEDRSHIDKAVSLDEGIAGQCVREQRAVIIDDYHNWHHRLGWIDDSVYHALAVPLLLSQQPVGALVVGRMEGQPGFDDNDKRLLSLLANLASPMVRNAQLYEQVDAAQKQAESANRVKTRFLASVTHELRTPLNLVINNMDFMRIGMFGEVNDEQRERLNQTIRSAEHLLYLINDLLDVSKIEAGEMQMFFQPTDLQPVLEDTIDSTLALIDATKPVTLQADIPEDLPQVTMDARRVRQVLLNLLSNAVKFTSEGEVRLTVKPVDGGVEFIVKDTGIGIPPDDIDLIFEAFERSKPSKHMGIEGTGLGLPISRYLAEAHGGQLRVESEVGKGSTFTFFLPLVPPQTGDQPRAAAFIGQGD